MERNGLWITDLGTVAYEPTVELQRRLRTARERGVVPDTLLVLEHEPVITTGHRTESHEVAYALTKGMPVVPTERGGKATYHGPGQVVVYPVFDLTLRGSDVKAFVCALERALIRALAQLGIEAGRREGYPGVWVGQRKIGSIGIRVTKWVSYHGIALNVNCDLEPFGWFTPCGLPDVQMTSVARELAGEADLARARALLVSSLVQEFGSGRDVQQVDDMRVRKVAAEWEPAAGLVPVQPVQDRMEIEA